MSSNGQIEQAIYTVNSSENFSNRETTDGLLNYNEAILYSISTDAENAQKDDNLPTYQDLINSN